MNIFLLDVVVGTPTVGNFGDGIWILLLILLVIIAVEAVIMLLSKINRFGKSFLQSALVNIVSTLAGYLFVSLGGGFNGSVPLLTQWAIFFGITVLIEGLLMMVLNAKTSKGKLWLVTIVMNLASYILLYLISSL